ncbi:MAG: 3-hydroxybutyryl-CoA dehydratase [Bacteroidia bacterium]
MTPLENSALKEIQLGDSVNSEKTLTERNIVLFAEVSGEVNPAHLETVR